MTYPRDLPAIAYRDVTMLIETRRNYTEASLLSPSLPSLFTRRARLPRFERNATPLVARTIGEDREYIHITHRSFILRKKEKKKEGRSQSVIFWRVISFFFFLGEDWSNDREIRGSG